jgi:hypothetical protein
MARKDNILHTFLKHKLLTEKYRITAEEQSMSLREALNSNNVVITTIAIIIDNMEANPPIADGALRTIITTYLSTAAI